MSALITEYRSKQRKLVEDARSFLNQINDGVDEARSKELEDMHDKAMADHDLLSEKIAREERMIFAESNLSKPATDVPVEENRKVTIDNNEPSYQDIFYRYLRHGAAELDREERSILNNHAQVENRAQSAGVGSEGGYTVPVGFIGRVIEKMKFIGPMMDSGIVNVLDTDGGNKITIPTLDDTSNEGTQIDENTVSEKSDLVFGQVEIDAYLYSSRAFAISESLMQDTGVDIERVLSDSMGTRLGRIANRHLTVGDGVNKPNGIVTASQSGAVTSGIDSITYDEILDLFHSVDISYRDAARAGFMFNDDTLRALRKVKDAEGRYIWQPPEARTEQPATLFGKTYAINNHMPGLGAGNKFMLFGDMSQYMVRRVRGFSLKRLAERYADSGQVGFISFMRLDGELLDNTAIKALSNAQ